jgi:hypothetical protein
MSQPEDWCQRALNIQSHLEEIVHGYLPRAELGGKGSLFSIHNTSHKTLNIVRANSREPTRWMPYLDEGNADLEKVRQIFS